MLLQAKNRKGLSVVIGYVLLIAISIVMSVIVYQWLKTYVPTESLKCDDGTSLFIKSVSYNCTSNILSVRVKNNGKFSIEGYFIHASNTSDSNSLATIDLSSGLLEGGEKSVNSIIFSNLTNNALTPNEPNNEKLTLFNSSGYGILKKIEILPIRIQTENDKKRIVSCSDAKVEENINCVY